MMVVCTSCGKLYGADKSCGGHFTHIKGCMEIRCCSGGHLEPYSIFREPSGLPAEAPKENGPKARLSWAIWCDKDKDYHTLDGAIRLFSHKEEATRYRHCQRDEPTCDRVVEVEIQPK